ncbi:hypothetical protein EYC98_14400 [Halieaceae bacterium IMCC14734]|uniref:Uncharacterized protein n=1 Tax=Candidatus Litorirhabdus singularis TaxID=2518993 RepID=A0ABT3TIK9_9GAMM|nr:hypothetical protein [Candidatus Litorirhabdus singularis]MCX2982050.1 hypothetical protein [Candidatus Litorirhabdus singularis]
MIKALRIYSIAFCVLLFIGETAVLLTTNKFWPLSVDDYVAIAVLLYSLRSLERLEGQLLQLGTWAYMSGKLYTMIFMKLDPALGTSESVLALSVLLAETVVGLILVWFCIRAGNRA